MALQGSGQIKLSEIASEFNDTGQFNLSSFYKGGSLVRSTYDGTGSVPTTGQITLSNFYGAAYQVTVSQGATNNLNLQTLFGTTDYQSNVPKVVNFTGAVGSTNSAYAVQAPSGAGASGGITLNLSNQTITGPAGGPVIDNNSSATVTVNGPGTLDKTDVPAGMQDQNSAATISVSTNQLTNMGPTLSYIDGSQRQWCQTNLQNTGGNGTRSYAAWIRDEFGGMGSDVGGSGNSVGNGDHHACWGYGGNGAGMPGIAAMWAGSPSQTSIPEHPGTFGFIRKGDGLKISVGSQPVSDYTNSLIGWRGARNISDEFPVTFTNPSGNGTVSWFVVGGGAANTEGNEGRRGDSGGGSAMCGIITGLSGGETFQLRGAGSVTCSNGYGPHGRVSEIYHGGNTAYLNAASLVVYDINIRATGGLDEFQNRGKGGRRWEAGSNSSSNTGNLNSGPNASHAKFQARFNAPAGGATQNNTYGPNNQCSNLVYDGGSTATITVYGNWGRSIYGGNNFTAPGTWYGTTITNNVDDGTGQGWENARTARPGWSCIAHAQFTNEQRLMAMVAVRPPEAVAKASQPSDTSDTTYASTEWTTGVSGLNSTSRLGPCSGFWWLNTQHTGASIGYLNERGAGHTPSLARYWQRFDEYAITFSTALDDVTFNGAYIGDVNSTSTYYVDLPVTGFGPYTDSQYGRNSAQQGDWNIDVNSSNSTDVENFQAAQTGSYSEGTVTIAGTVTQS